MLTIKMSFLCLRTIVLEKILGVRIEEVLIMPKRERTKLTIRESKAKRLR